MEGAGAGAGDLPWLSAGLAASLVGAGAGAGVSRCSLEQMLVACTLNTRISNAPSETKWTSWQHFKLEKGQRERMWCFGVIKRSRKPKRRINLIDSK